MYENIRGVAPIRIKPFTKMQVRAKLYSAENTAPGSDGITYENLRQIDTDVVIMTLILNGCIKYGKVLGK